MVVASICFAFRALITQAQIWKSFQAQNSTSLLYLPIPSSAETWKIVTKKVCQFFFAWADILSEKSPYFGKHIFAKQELITRARLQLYKTLRLVRISLLISAITKSFAFFSGKLFYKSNRKLFSCVRILDSYANPRLRLGFAQLSRILPTPLLFISRYCKHQKRFPLLKYYLVNSPSPFV